MNKEQLIVALDDKDVVINKGNIKEYYANQNIAIKRWLEENISANNTKALYYLDYAIKNLLGISGIKDLLQEIADIDTSGIEGERIYHNAIMEFHAIYFVHSVLKLKIMEIESVNNIVLSPHRKGNKSCDIKAMDNSREYFFESKDVSSEIINRDCEGFLRPS